jgi:hypothetical protein
VSRWGSKFKWFVNGPKVSAFKLHVIGGCIVTSLVMRDHKVT